jgi:RNA polymerase sigma-70 factor (ECF subfamily)
MDEAGAGGIWDTRPKDTNPVSSVRLGVPRNGDRASLARLFEQHRGLVVGVCAGVLGRSHLLADAVQEVFVKLLLSAEQIRDAAKFGPWLGSVARNTALDLARKESRQVRPPPPPPPQQQPGPLDALIRDEESRRALDAVMDLRPEFREVILLRYMHSGSYREIAETLGVPVSTVETRLHRARRELVVRLRK